MSTAEQWETVTVRVQDIEPGWLIGFGGMLVEIYDIHRLARALNTSDVDLGPLGCLTLANDTEVEVRRTDPDAELVEILSKTSWEGDGSKWDHASSGDQASVRSEMRAALAAARAAGWRIERAS